jgi:hypothetical protein
MSVEKEELQLGLKFPELSNLGNDAARGKWPGIPKILIAFWIHRCWSWLHKAIGCIETHTKPNTTEQSNPMWQLHSSTTVPKKGKRDKLPLWTLISEEICASKLTTQGSSRQDVVGKVVWVVTSTPLPPLTSYLTCHSRLYEVKINVIFTRSPQQNHSQMERVDYKTSRCQDLAGVYSCIWIAYRS